MMKLVSRVLFWIAVIILLALMLVPIFFGKEDQQPVVPQPLPIIPTPTMKSLGVDEHELRPPGISPFIDLRQLLPTSTPTPIASPMPAPTPISTPWPYIPRPHRPAPPAA